MSLGLAFWILMLVWFVFSAVGLHKDGNMWALSGSVLTFVLFLLLGWQVFGPPIRG